MPVIGTTVKKQVTFRDTNGALTDPNAVNANAKTPSGVSVVATSVVHPSTGIYDVLYDATEAGLWFYRVEGEGNDVDAVAEGSFCVIASSVK